MEGQDECQDPDEPILQLLSEAERDAVSIFAQASSLWNWAGGGMSAPIRTGLRYSDVESVARSHGLEWSGDLLDLIRECERFLLNQDNDRRREQNAADEAKRAADEARNRP